MNLRRIAPLLAGALLCAPVPAPGLPARDAARIARVRRAPFTPAEMGLFLSKVRSAVERRLPAATRKDREAVLRALQARAAGPAPVAGGAIGAWISGDLELALFLAGRAAALAPEDPDVVANYAAFLVMAGGETAALPILYTLARDHPGNTTVLNNLGQAWFGLGDVDEARKSLDEAIRRHPLHSQANATVSVIEEASGNLAAAAAAAHRSIQFGYSDAKAARLRRLGRPLEPRDVHWALHVPQDPLALHKFLVPPYPMTVEEAVDLDPRWEAFHSAVQAAGKVWSGKLNALADALGEAERKRMEGYAAAVARGRRPANVAVPGPYARKAARLLLSEQEDHARRVRLWEEKARGVRAEIDRLEEEHGEAFMAVEARYANRLDDTTREQCAALDDVNNRRIRAINGLLRPLQADRLAIEARWANEGTYLHQFTSTSELDLETEKARAKSRFLDRLGEIRHVSNEPCAPAYSGEKEPTGRGPLPEFDDFHCEYHTRLDFVALRIELDCNHMTTTFKAGPLAGKVLENVLTGHVVEGSLDIGPLSGTVTQDERTGELVRGTLEGAIGVKGGVDAGPVAVEVGAKIGGFVEVDANGVSDWGMSGGVKVTAETDAFEGVAVETPVGEKTILQQKGPSVEIEIGVRAGVNSGPSLEGKGVLGAGFGAGDRSF